HAHAAAGHRDLSEHEAVTALDEPDDALAHRPQRNQTGHADGDAHDGEEVAAQRADERHHSRRDPTGRPARRRTQTLTRARANRMDSDRRVRHGMRLKKPPASTPSTASSAPKRSDGFRNSSRNAGS